MRIICLLYIGIVGILLCGVSVVRSNQASNTPVEFTDEQRKRIFNHSPLPPPPPDPTNRWADDPAAAHFGQYLFYDTRLSSSGAFSCASCHDPEKGFADGLAVAQGAGKGTKHTLSLWNVAYNRWFFWNGRADTLWSQALQPMERASELDSNRTHIAKLIYTDPQLREAYESIFGLIPDLSNHDRFPPDAKPVNVSPTDPLNRAWESMKECDKKLINRIFVNVAKALAAYERKIVSRRAPFDIFVEGLQEDIAKKRRAMTISAKRGLQLFVGRGNCRFCHVGPNFTDGEFHSIRLAPVDDGSPRDPGRFGGVKALLDNKFNATGPYSDDPESMVARKIEFLAKNPEQWGQFKTPSLRNVAETAPYMHAGHFATLREVLEHYSTFEDALPAGHHGEQILRPLNLSRGEKDDLIAFLKSLTDQNIKQSLQEQPDSPVYEVPREK